MKLHDKKILVTGGNGFFGSAVVAALIRHGVSRNAIATPHSKEHDLTRSEDCRKVVDGQNVVIHLAARVGGIGANKAHPGKFFYENAMMGIQLIEAARLAGAEKFVTIGTVCEYPENPPVPFKEENLWDGYPTPVTASYGLAKKMLLVQGKAYKEEYGFNSIHILPTNLYGPGDNFDPDDSHVMAALIRRAVIAAEKSEPFLEVWGTGKATRDFLYIDDAAEAVVRATEDYDKTDPVNIGSGRETSIKELAEMIVKTTGFKGELRWDTSKPDGQPRRQLDISRAKKEFGFDPKTSLEDGVRTTVAWYRAHPF
jgi:GDP-L-fucose synthase